MQIEQVLDASYATQRYGWVRAFDGEVVLDGAWYHAVPNSGDAQWVRQDGGIDAVSLSAIPPAPYAPAWMTDTEARCLHILTWGKRAWLTAYAAAYPQALTYAITDAKAMARGERMLTTNTYNKGAQSIWWRSAISDLGLTPERVYP